jgi:DNA-directed RNA polymerase subunit RPC12/RpoP
MTLSYLPGRPARLQGPLSRFLPPLESGVVEGLLAAYDPTAICVLDPFGTSPQLVKDAANAGFPVLVAVNNPILRHALVQMLQPPDPAELQAALAELAQLPKDGSRLEAFLLDLYATTCVRCGRTVAADYFIWDDELHEPYLKGYVCPHCSHAGEEETDDEDRRQARAYERRDLSWAQALESVAPAGDPDRSHAEAALAVYPGRARYALVTLVNKLAQLPDEDRHGSALDSLLISAFDASDSMWAYPEGRARPKQLTASPRFREINVWRALERAVTAWEAHGTQVPLAMWPESGSPRRGEVALFSGPVKGLSESIPSTMQVVVLTCPPRPNQAFWTLSALWTAWLWGREAAQPIKAALRRRRYDWAWHAGALQLAAHNLVDVLDPATPWIGLVPEAEPGYVAAVVSGLDASELGLEGWAIRVDDAQAQLRWRRRRTPLRQGPIDLTELADEVVTSTLAKRAEPTPYLVLHAAVGADWAGRGVFRALWKAEGGQPVASLNLALETALGNRSRVVRLDQRQEIETGLFWLTRPEKQPSPLTDQVEVSVLDALRRGDPVEPLALDREICSRHPGLATPDRELVYACADSYALMDDSGLWSLRPEDETEARASDSQAIRRQLWDIGERLGFQVGDGPYLAWREISGEAAYTFVVLETAAIQAALAASGQGLILVIPGGRAALLAEKARRDPRLAERLRSGIRILKYRHVRRLAGDNTLTLDNLVERMAVDPLEHEDPQLPLL